MLWYHNNLLITLIPQFKKPELTYVHSSEAEVT